MIGALLTSVTLLSAQLYVFRHVCRFFSMYSLWTGKCAKSIASKRTLILLPMFKRESTEKEKRLCRTACPLYEQSTPSAVCMMYHWHITDSRGQHWTTYTLVFSDLRHATIEFNYAENGDDLELVLFFLPLSSIECIHPLFNPSSHP